VLISSNRYCIVSCLLNKNTNYYNCTEMKLMSNNSTKSIVKNNVYKTSKNTVLTERTLRCATIRRHCCVARDQISLFKDFFRFFICI